MTPVAVQLVTMTPVTDTSIYASGDQVGTGATELTHAVRNPSNLCTLESISIVDKSKQKAALDILFFSSEPTIASANNAPLDITDAELAAKYIGKVSIAAADYGDLANSAVASVKAIGLVLRNKKANTQDPDKKSIWAVICSRGTPTYTSASDLVLQLGFYQH